MKHFLSLILLFFSELIAYSNTQIPVWSFKKAATELLPGNTDFYQYTIYGKEEDSLHLTKELNRTTPNNIVQNNYIKLNDNRYNTKWEDILNYYDIKNKRYICPSGNNYLSLYSNNKIEEIKHAEKTVTEIWDLICYYQENKNIIYISYLNSDDKNIYGYKINDDSWFKFPMHSGYLDIIWPKTIDSNIYHLFVILTSQNGIMLGKIEVTISDKENANMINSEYFVDTKLEETFAFFDEKGYLYWMTYNHTYFLSGYSTAPLDDFSKSPKDIKVIKHAYSPFEFIENITINYVYFIRNTKYAYYEVKSNDNITYHGVIDVTLNKIIMNTDEDILDFKPYSKNSLLFVTEKSAYKICVFAQKDDECINECPENQELILDPTNKNFCGKENDCEHYMLKPISICVNECDPKFYVIQNEKFCGFCKNLNNTHPYKVMNESFCREDKPTNTYIYDEQLFLLNYCHSSCLTCFGEKDDQCLSCVNGSLIDGKCYVNDCPDGYYMSNNQTCEKCDTNCLTCDGPSENGNNHCTSCYNDSLLIIADGFNNNCVDKCPEKTKLDNENKKCINENSGNNNKDETKNTSSGKRYLIWILIIFVIIILLIVILIILKKCCNKNRTDNNMIENVNKVNDINLNEA